MLAPAGDMVGPGSPFTEVKAAIRSDRWLVLWMNGPRLEVARVLGSLPRWHHNRRNPLAGCSYRAGSRRQVPGRRFVRGDGLRDLAAVLASCGACACGR